MCYYFWGNYFHITWMLLCKHNGLIMNKIRKNTFPNVYRLLVQIMSLNGGFLQVKNYDSASGPPTIDPPQYYNGSWLTHNVNFTVDFEKPYHCSTKSSMDCGDMLNRGPAYTKVVSFC